MRKRILPILIAIILVSSCERDAKNVILPEFVRKLVINSFISPRDTVSFVSVKSNKKLYGTFWPDPEDEKAYGNITATLSDGSRETALTRIDEGFIFRQKDMLIEEGKTYSLKVMSDLGMQAEASVTIPFRRPINIEIDTLRKSYDYGDGSGMQWTELIADITITDYADEENFYSFACKQVVYNSEYAYYPYHIPFYFYESSVFSDKGKDGEKLFVNSFSYMNPSRDDSSDLIVYILQTDKDYYTYHYSLAHYSGGQDPFTEISPAWSNIEGGLGIFASYVVDSLVLKVK